MPISREEIWWQAFKNRGLYEGKKKRIKNYLVADEVLAEFDKRFSGMDERSLEDDPTTTVRKQSDNGTDIITFNVNDELFMLGVESEEWLSIKAINIKEGFIIRHYSNEEPARVESVTINESEEGYPNTVTAYVSTSPA